jgi:hypothetical protein
MWSWKAKTSSSGQPADDLWLKDIISDLNGEQQVKGAGPARGIHSLPMGRSAPIAGAVSDACWLGKAGWHPAVRHSRAPHTVLKRLNV